MADVVAAFGDFGVFSHAAPNMAGTVRERDLEFVDATVSLSNVSPSSSIDLTNPELLTFKVAKDEVFGTLSAQLTVLLTGEEQRELKAIAERIERRVKALIR
jgi:hypothetical protein